MRKDFIADGVWRVGADLFLVELKTEWMKSPQQKDKGKMIPKTVKVRVRDNRITTPWPVTENQRKLMLANVGKPRVRKDKLDVVKDMASGGQGSYFQEEELKEVVTTLTGLPGGEEALLNSDFVKIAIAKGIQEGLAQVARAGDGSLMDSIREEALKESQEEDDEEDEEKNDFDPENLEDDEDGNDSESSDATDEAAEAGNPDSEDAGSQPESGDAEPKAKPSPKKAAAKSAPRKGKK